MCRLILGTTALGASDHLQPFGFFSGERHEYAHAASFQEEHARWWHGALGH